jgi:hypothetical protein
LSLLSQELCQLERAGGRRRKDRVEPVEQIHRPKIRYQREQGPALSVFQIDNGFGGQSGRLGELCLTNVSVKALFSKALSQIFLNRSISFIREHVICKYMHIKAVINNLYARRFILK